MSKTVKRPISRARKIVRRDMQTSATSSELASRRLQAFLPIL
jgi:hypothetical protein